LALEIQEFEQLEEASCQFEQIHIHLIRKVDQQIGSLLRPQRNVKCSCRISLHAFTFLEETEAVRISHNTHSRGQPESIISYA
jgi:hypothetical protein